MNEVRFYDMGSVDLTGAIFSVVKTTDTPLTKARKFLWRICPEKIREYRDSKNKRRRRKRRIPEFYPKIYCTQMKYHAKWLDKEKVEAEIRRLDEDCDSSIYQI